MNENDLNELATMLGLKIETLEDLFANGWAYEAKLYYPRAFYSSVHSWKNETKDK